MIPKSQRDSHQFPFLHSLCLCASVACLLFLPQPLSLVLFVADLFHPVDGLAIKMFQDGDVRHGRG